VLDNLGETAEGGHAGYARYIASIPFHPELELFVRVKSMGID
jgi:hypothetical protein